MTQALLKTSHLESGYGNKQILFGLNLELFSHEVVAIIGHNGAGKSTFLKTIFGLNRIWNGTVEYAGTVIGEPSPSAMRDRGIVFVPQGNRVFADLSVFENLELAGLGLDEKERFPHRLDYVLNMFPILRERLTQKGATLSGGERQMLALACAVLLNPRLLLLDEPSLGLAPAAASAALDRIRELCSTLGCTALIVEQRVREVLRITDKVCVLRNGRVSYFGVSSELADDEKLREVYL